MLTIFITHPACSQDKPKEDGKKTVKIKVITSDNGKTKAVDTTFSTSLMLDSKEVEEMLKGVQGCMNDSLKKCMAKVIMIGGKEVDAPDCNMRFMHSGFGEATLSDLIGYIPMSRVKGYTVKDTKNGKRIVIDVEDAPLMERHDN